MSESVEEEAERILSLMDEKQKAKFLSREIEKKLLHIFSLPQSSNVRRKKLWHLSQFFFQEDKIEYRV